MVATLGYSLDMLNTEAKGNAMTKRTETGSDPIITAPDDTPTQCPECGIGDSEYGLHESDCPSGGDGWDEAR